MEDQERHYELLEQLQHYVKTLDVKTQQRLPYDLLANLASCLRDNAIFTIVDDLEEIQHLTEKNLYTQRQKILNEQKAMRLDLRKKQTEAIQNCKRHNLPLVKAEHDKQTSELEKRLSQELKSFDMKLLSEIDQKVMVQQATLKSAGVPGFYITQDQQEIKQQMILLDLVKMLGASNQNRA